MSGCWAWTSKTMMFVFCWQSHVMGRVMELPAGCCCPRRDLHLLSCRSFSSGVFISDFVCNTWPVAFKVHAAKLFGTLACILLLRQFFHVLKWCSSGGQLQCSQPQRKNKKKSLTYCISGPIYICWVEQLDYHLKKSQHQVSLRKLRQRTCRHSADECSGTQVICCLCSCCHSL